MWEVNDQEFEAVLRQTADKQYAYFVGHCADWGEVWGFATNGTDWATLENADGFAVWPHARFAEACRRGNWAERKPTPIEIHAFVEELLPKLIAEGVDVAVFPLPDGRFTPISASQLLTDLEAELSRLE